MSTLQSAGSAGMRSAPEDRLFSLPKTKLGRWSMWLAVAFILMFAVNSVFIGLLGRARMTLSMHSAGQSCRSMASGC